MRSIEDARQRWNTSFRDNDTPSDLRSALRSDQGDKLCNDGLRSIYWKALLLFDNLERAQWPRRLAESQSAYVALKAHFFKYIDHPDDLQSTVDPLADDEQSPWQTLRHDEQMRADISQDVDRCLQENFFFREPATKAKMIDVLFIYAKLNPDLGYRQGMHEILAPILWVVDRDAIEPKSLEGSESTNGDDDIMLQLLNADYVEHDSFALFCAAMQSIRGFYEHNSHRASNGQMDAIPIVNQCHHIHNNLLAMTDLELADHLQALEILPQIFLTRWMRLLFGREFPFQEVLAMWDLLFVEGLRPELVDFVCVAMLLRVRWRLLKSDSSTVLTTLLRYPSPHPHAPLTFVHDALYLEQNPGPERGSFIIAKYSGKPPDLSKRQSQPSSRPLSMKRFQLRSSETNSPSRSPARNSPKSLEAMFSDFSEGIQRKTESWGVAKAVRGAVSEARKNMQTVQAEHGPHSTMRHDSAPPNSTLDGAADHSAVQDTADVSLLQNRIEALEERNRMLAKSLGLALKDMRSQVLGTDKLDAEVTTSVKDALSTVESVQKCLEDSSLSLEVEDPPPATDTSPATDTDADTEKPPDKEKSPEVKSEEKKESKEERATQSSSLGEVPEKPSQTSSEDPPKPRGSSIFSHRKLTRPPARPSLADSEFSWMLGGDSRHLSGFVSPASEPPEQSRHGETKARPNSLFGNGDEEQKRAQAEPDSLAMRSLRGPKGR